MRQSTHSSMPDRHESNYFREGDRVMASARPGFPSGTVVRTLNAGHLLVRWDCNMLETVHESELEPSDSAELRH